MRKFLIDTANAVIDKLQAKFPVNRLVVLLTPLVFAPAAGWVSVEAAKLVPGHPHYGPHTILGLFVAGALIAFGKAYKWLDGWQKHEALATAGTKTTRRS
jgi:peptidoglycan/LPS O-acetylase OafA/YrhL